MLQKATQISTQRGFKMAAKLLDFLLEGLWFESMSFELSATFLWAKHINDNFPLVLFPLLWHTVRTQWQGYLREPEVTLIIQLNNLLCSAWLSFYVSVQIWKQILNCDFMCELSVSVLWFQSLLLTASIWIQMKLEDQTDLMQKCCRTDDTELEIKTASIGV